VEILKLLRDCAQKRPELWPNDWILHRDIVPAHKAPLSSSLWPKNRILKMEYPSHSPDLVPNDLWLFPEIKSALKGLQDIK
jgi:hypothetical protein